VVARFEHAAKDVLKFGLIAQEAQHGCATSPLDAYPKQIFCGRVEVNDQQVVVNENNASAEAVENTFRVVLDCPAVVGTLTGPAA
jgi:hypothetical protein